MSTLLRADVRRFIQAVREHLEHVMPARERIYRIGKAAAAVGVKTSVLRFWETEFPELKPIRGEGGQRGYTARHMELLRRIRELLYTRGLTIEGARQALRRSALTKDLPEEETEARGRELEQRRRENAQRRREHAARRREEDTAFLRRIQEELTDLRALLAGGAPVAATDSACRPSDSPGSDDAAGQPEAPLSDDPAPTDTPGDAPADSPSEPTGGGAAPAV